MRPRRKKRSMVENVAPSAPTIVPPPPPPPSLAGLSFSNLDLGTNLDLGFQENTILGNDLIDTTVPPPSLANLDFSNLDLGINLDLGFGDPYNLPSTNILDLPTPGDPGLDMNLNQVQIATSSALPSLPSISNVGSVPFTGTVSNIPGGFQPLPQTAGGRKKLYQLSKFHGGINQKSSPRDIADFECQEATNVTVSQIGRIKLLGDCLNENAIGVDVGGATGTASFAANFPGYGLFQFVAPADWDAENVGEYVFTCTANGDEVDILSTPDPDTDGIQVGWMSGLGTTDDTTVCQVYYASGNGLYVADANFDHGNASKANIYVYREDAGSNTVSGWKEGKPLIDSPTFDSDSDDAMATGTVRCTSTGGDNAGDLIVDVSGSAMVKCLPVETGTWDGTYLFYISWLFDGGVETGLTSFAGGGVPASVADDGDSSGIVFSNNKLYFNLSLKHANGTPLGGDKRIEGARIYFKKIGDTERFLLVEFNMIDGVKGALDSTFIPWNENSDIYNLGSFEDATCDTTDTDETIAHDDDDGKISVGMNVTGTGIPAGAYVASITSDTSFELSVAATASNTDTTLTFSQNDIVFDAPPEVYSYASLNGYYANEIYDVSNNSIASTTAGPTAHNVRYKAAVVGSGGIVFIGNVKFKGKHMADSMMFSMPGKPGAFPQYNRFDSPSSDGSPITALAAYRDTILQFKENGMYVINVSNPAQFYAEASFRDCGVFNPCQVFTTSFGVIFANKNGCYIYDGQKVTSLTDGKFDWLNQSGVSESTSNASDASVPCVGYDPRSQSIIVLKNIGDDAAQENDTTYGAGAWVYSMVTQSWTEGDDIITNTDGRRHTNFIITNDGYLAIKRDNDGTLLNYNHVQPDRDQTINYTTKDLDFGMPSQTKKIFKVYVTYFSDDSAVPTMTFGVDGDTTPTESFDSGAFASSGGLQTTAWTVNDAALTGIKSLSLKISGATDHSFEIQDIAILYRARPIK